MEPHCQSGFKHGSRDLHSHFFGCVKASQQEALFERIPERSRARIREEQLRIYRLRLIFEARQDLEEGILLGRHKQSLRQWRECTRLKTRRQSPPRRVQNGHLSKADDLKYGDLGDDDLKDGDLENSSLEDGDPEDDDLGDKPKNRRLEGYAKRLYLDQLFDDEDVFANMMFFKNSAPHTLKDFLPQEFPEQKISLKSLLYDQDPVRNPLVRPCSDGTIRYFHVPANDMKWVEELMACYYRETDTFTSKRDDWVGNEEGHRTKSKILLDQGVWRGQQRGPSINDPVHTRSMRPCCELTNTGEQSAGAAASKNLVLFMPYLHWETYSARVLQARTIKACDQGVRLTSRKFSDIAQMTITNMASTDKKKGRSRRLWRFKPMKYFASGYPTNDLNASQYPFSKKPSKYFLQNSNTLKESSRSLGEVLLHAAALATAMDFYTDKTLLQNRLDLTPPLHPRRTLDQYYYWALKDIESQDKSQVVYRATAPKRHLPDQFAERDLECRECLQDIRSVPRLLMVDQLWLWILDEHTVITFFPARWGIAKNDNSDVHLRLQERLKVVQKEEINSVYDLAIVIINQCSEVFFDRATVSSLRPQVVEIFAHAIGDVSFKQITSFNHFLEYTRLFTAAYKARHEKKSVVRHQSIIDINTEVKLLQEIKDVLDELNIMISCLREQQSVCKTFTRHIQGIVGTKLEETEVMSDPLEPISQPTILARRRYKHTMSRANNLLEGINERIAEFQRLADTATETSSALNDLLSLKQQQMGVVEARLEARESVEQGRETLRQGRTIMLFTVVTIIFMPLSFVTSIFGMNVAELNGGNLTFHQEFQYTFPLSLGFSLVTLFVAFRIYNIP